jgi:hypothetical protein
MARVESSSRGFERERDRRHDKSPDPKKDGGTTMARTRAATPDRFADRFGACRASPPRQAPKSFQSRSGAPGRLWCDAAAGRPGKPLAGCQPMRGWPASDSAGGRLTQQPVAGATHRRDAVRADFVAQVAYVYVHHVG